MSSPEAQYSWEHIGLMRLMGGLLLAPFAWFLDLQVSYVAVKWACAHDRAEALLLIPLGSLALIGAAAWMSWARGACCGTRAARRAAAWRIAATFWR